MRRHYNSLVLFLMAIMCVAVLVACSEPHNHSYGDWIYDSTEHWHECDCGYKIDSAEHFFDGGTISIPPTYESTGIKTFTCSICGCQDTAIIPKLEPQGSIIDFSDLDNILAVITSGKNATMVVKYANGTEGVSKYTNNRMQLLINGENILKEGDDFYILAFNNDTNKWERIIYNNWQGWFSLEFYALNIFDKQNLIYDINTNTYSGTVDDSNATVSYEAEQIIISILDEGTEVEKIIFKDIGTTEIVLPEYDNIIDCTAEMVRTNSMAPALNLRDIVVYKHDTSDFAVGDIVVFEVSEGSGTSLRIHRIIDITEYGVITKGDNNPFPDSNVTPFANITGIVISVNGVALQRSVAN